MDLQVGQPGLARVRLALLLDQKSAHFSKKNQIASLGSSKYFRLREPCYLSRDSSFLSL